MHISCLSLINRHRIGSPRTCCLLNPFQDVRPRLEDGSQPLAIETCGHYVNYSRLIEFWHKFWIFSTPRTGKWRRWWHGDGICWVFWVEMRLFIFFPLSRREINPTFWDVTCCMDLDALKRSANSLLRRGLNSVKVSPAWLIQRPYSIPSVSSSPPNHPLPSGLLGTYGKPRDASNDAALSIDTIIML